MNSEKDVDNLDPTHFSQDKQRKKLSHSHDKRRQKNKSGGNSKQRASWEKRESFHNSSDESESKDTIDGALLNLNTEIPVHSRFKHKSASLPQNLKPHEFKRCPQIVPSSNLFTPGNNTQPLETEEEYLYCQVLQTVVNPLGAPDLRDGYKPQDLAKHLRKVFEIDQNVHSKYVQYVQKNKPSNVVLNVTVIEASNMRAMDADGFSDPYCILELVGSGKGSPKMSPHGSPIQKRRFGSLNSIENSLDGDTTMKKTKIKSKTLNPRWNESFELDVRNLSTDELVIVFWDYDEEGILSSMKSMDKHHGIKVLYRQLKQHMEMGKQADDFMGYIQIPLRDIPASGSEEWHDIKMDKKSNKGKTCGKCKLKLELSVKHVSPTENVDELDSPESDQCSIEEYYMTVKKFYKHAMKETQEKQLGSSIGEMWALPEHSRMILRQFAVQNHIQSLSQSLLELVVILELLVDENKKCLLSGKLLKDMIVNIEMECLTAKTSRDESLTSKTDNFLPLTKTEQKMFERAAGDYLEKTIRVLDELPNMFPPRDLDLDVLSTKISLMVSILNLHIWKCIDHKDMEAAKKDVSSLLILRIQDDVKAYTQSLIDNIASKCVGKDPELIETRHFVAMLQDLMTILNPTYSLSQYFHRIGVDYFKVVSIAVESKVTPKAKFLVHQLEAYLVKYQKFHVNVKEVSGLSLQLYFSLTRFSTTVKNNLPDRESFKLSVLEYQSWFETSVMFWLQTFREECIQRMEKALEIEKDVVQVTALVKYSNSALDVMACFSKITSEWKMIDFKDADIQLLGVTKITDTLCDGASQYANKVEQILENNGYYDWNDNAQFDVTDQLCITLNNIEYVRNYLGELKDLLKFGEIAKAMVLKHELPDLEEKTYNMLNGLVRSSNDDIKHYTSRILQKITDKMSVDLKKYIDLITSHDYQLKDFDALLDYLDTNLEVLYEKLSSSVFPVILQGIWNTVLNTMENNLQRGEKPEYYQMMKKHLQNIQSYFDKGQCGEDGTYSTQYLRLRDKIDLQALCTEELILKHLSFLALSKYQGADSYGSLTVKCAHVKETGGIICILVKLIQANGLPGANKNGLSDPQVTLTLVPQFMFSTLEPKKSKKLEKTVNPVFEELIECPPVMQDTAQTPGASIVFSVWNCNIFLSNEFLGEAVVEINDIPDLGNRISVDYLAATILQLRKPNDEESEAFQVLQDRSSWDKAAATFIKHRESMTGTVRSPIKTVLNSFMG